VAPILEAFGVWALAVLAELNTKAAVVFSAEEMHTREQLRSGGRVPPIVPSTGTRRSVVSYAETGADN
jgi:hypothetical protein